jgi:hypothetical protein
MRRFQQQLSSMPVNAVKLMMSKTKLLKRVLLDATLQLVPAAELMSHV